MKMKNFKRCMAFMLSAVLVCGVVYASPVGMLEVSAAESTETSQTNGNSQCGKSNQGSPKCIGVEGTEAGGGIVVNPAKSTGSGILEADGTVDADDETTLLDGETPLADMATASSIFDAEAAKNCIHHDLALDITFVGLVLAVMLAKRKSKLYWMPTTVAILLAGDISSKGSCCLDVALFACEVGVTIVVTAAIWRRVFKKI